LSLASNEWVEAINISYSSFVNTLSFITTLGNTVSAIGTEGTTVVPTYNMWPTFEFLGFHGLAIGIEDGIGFAFR
jgi:hypothetical protein